MLRSKIVLLTIFLISFIILSFSYLNFVLAKVEKKIYQTTSNELHTKMDLLIKEKQGSLLKIVITLAQYQRLQSILLSGNYKDIHLELITNELRLKTSYKEVWFQVIDAEGKSFYRSWTDKRGDSILKARIDIAELIKKPEIKSTISVGKYDLTFKSIVPIYKDEKFIGLIESIAKFGSISKRLESQGILPVFIVDARYTKQLIAPYTKRFMGNNYIANKEADETFISTIQSIGLSSILKQKNNYYIDEKSKSLISVYRLKDVHNKDMSYMLLSKKISDVNFNEMYTIRSKFEIFFVFSFVFFLMFFAYFMLKSKKEALDYQAHHDTLTKLPNRLLFVDRLDQAIKHGDRHQKEFDLLFIDLNHFKYINDTYGHSVGDKILVEAAVRIEGALRAEDSVARLGGDEFTVILEDIETKEDIIKILDKLVEALSSPLAKDFGVSKIEASIGVARYPHDARTVNTLMTYADQAMYKSKEKKETSYTFFNDD